MLLSMGLSICIKLQLIHCHAQEKTIDNKFREMRSEFTQESIVNKWRQ